jgi:hypothetical protein
MSAEEDGVRTMNTHATLNLSFDPSGMLICMPAGVVGARSGSDVGTCRIGQYATEKLNPHVPLTV